MRILIAVPLKPVVLVWGLLTAMIFTGFVASSMIEGSKSSKSKPTASSERGPKTSNSRDAKLSQAGKSH